MSIEIRESQIEEKLSAEKKIGESMQGLGSRAGVYYTYGFHAIVDGMTGYVMRDCLMRPKVIDAHSQTDGVIYVPAGYERLLFNRYPVTPDDEQHIRELQEIVKRGKEAERELLNWFEKKPEVDLSPE